MSLRSSKVIVNLIRGFSHYCRQRCKIIQEVFATAGEVTRKTRGFQIYATR